jgi:acyl-coenzyme A thioesterase PaaI-like protein
MGTNDIRGALHGGVISLVIDLRTDYLRPGIGKSFMSTGYALRTGNKGESVRYYPQESHPQPQPPSPLF